MGTFKNLQKHDNTAWQQLNATIITSIQGHTAICLVFREKEPYSPFPMVVVGVGRSTPFQNC